MRTGKDDPGAPDSAFTGADVGGAYGGMGLTGCGGPATLEAFGNVEIKDEPSGTGVPHPR